MNKGSKLYVKVPNTIIRNEGTDYLPYEFLLYVRLSFLYFRNYEERELIIDHRKLMTFLKINDTRTLKAKLKTLYDNNLIKNEITTLPRRGVLKIIFNDELYTNCKQFTMISAEIFNYYNTDQIGIHAFRLIFYYKSHINLKDTTRDRSYCFVGYDTLSKNLRISKTKIKEANEQLKKAGMIKIVKHKLEPTYEYDHDDELVYNRYNNHYYVAERLH